MDEKSILTVMGLLMDLVGFAVVASELFINTRIASLPALEEQLEAIWKKVSRNRMVPLEPNFASMVEEHK